MNLAYIYLRIFNKAISDKNPDYNYTEWKYA